MRRMFTRFMAPLLSWASVLPLPEAGEAQEEPAKPRSTACCAKRPRAASNWTSSRNPEWSTCPSTGAAS